jgi:hypothetical protein
MANYRAYAGGGRMMEDGDPFAQIPGVLEMRNRIDAAKLSGDDALVAELNHQHLLLLYPGYRRACQESEARRAGGRPGPGRSAGPPTPGVKAAMATAEALRAAGWRLDARGKATHVGSTTVDAPPAPPYWPDPHGHIRSAAEHEAGHAVVADHLGWEVEAVEVRRDGSGVTRMRPTEDTYGAELRRQRAVLTLAGRAAAGRSYAGGDRGDDWDLIDDATYTEREALEAEAARILALPAINARWRRLVGALMEHHKLEGAERVREAMR